MSSPPPSSSYSTPTAFRRAITDKLKALAKDGPWSTRDLQRQFAYDRLLSRMYMLDDGWILKGATALLAREIAARHTVDVDVFRPASREQVERDLRRAAAIELGDWFEFEIDRGIDVAQGAAGARFPVIARIGGTEWARFHIDVVGDSVRMTGVPDAVPALTTIEIDGMTRPGYRAYPIVDHIADKVCAILQRYGNDRPSTRFKDLVDIVVLVTTSSVNAGDQAHALTSEAERRKIQLPPRFGVPDRELWDGGYAAEARRAVKPVPARLDDALAVVRPFVDPILGGSASGRWQPKDQRWSETPTTR